MAWYMLRAKLTQSSVQGLVAKPQDRKLAVSKLAKSLGGKLHHYFFSFGKHDVVLILELPGHDEDSVAAVIAVEGQISVHIVDGRTGGTSQVDAAGAVAIARAGGVDGVDQRLQSCRSVHRLP